MIYVLAAIGVLAVAVLMWRAFSPVQSVFREQPAQQAPTTAPDDDPDFLRQLDEQQRRQRNNDETGEG